MEIELTAEEFLDEWRKLVGDVETEEYDSFEACVKEMEEAGVKFYLSDGVPLVDATEYLNEVDKLENLFDL